MILLDTDHLSVLVDDRIAGHALLRDRLVAAPDPDARLPIVAVEEQLRGWLAYLNRFKRIEEQVAAYARLLQLLEVIARWVLVPLDARAAAEFARLRALRLRVGSQDLKIASIALAHDATLLSRNLRDFTTVPGLRVENWL